MLPCLAAVAIATFVGTKTLESNASEGYGLLMANVEALSSGEDDGIDIADCYFNGSSIEMKCVKVCPDKTTTEKIYPCPTEERYLSTNARGNCVKK